jgi:hypothetical protein
MATEPGRCMRCGRIDWKKSLRTPFRMRSFASSSKSDMQSSQRALVVPFRHDLGFAFTDSLTIDHALSGFARLLSGLGFDLGLGFGALCP